MKATIRASITMLIGTALFISLSGSSYAAHRIILTNGSEFTVDSYEKIGDEVRIEYGGGIIGIKQKEIKGIIETKGGLPVKETPHATERPMVKQPTGVLEAQPEGTAEKEQELVRDNLNALNDDLAKKREELKTSRKDRKDLADKIAYLKEEARKRAVANYSDPATAGLYYLSAADRQWLIENEPNIAELDAKIDELQYDIARLISERDDMEKRMDETK